jgi:peptidoglycan/xylan/chitin deacetylase (PgdA/CDA1 family)
MNKNGALVISLDFELLWGIFDLVDHKQKTGYFKNTLNAIPAILKEFDQYDIHATWATVGMLFNENWEEWEKNQPEILPEYVNSSLSAYNFGKSIKDEDSEELVFAPELIRKISTTKGQEIGTHTYSHYYCLEEGQSKEQFTADLKKSIELAGKMDITLKSLIFPRNQFNQDYLKICAENGIENVRSNPSVWYWKNISSEKFLNKLVRSGDAYIPFGKKSYSLQNLKEQKGFPLEQNASRFFRPVEENHILRKLKLERIKKEITWAAKHGEIYHLWWHPHNFGNSRKESMLVLRSILEHFNYCRKKFNFQSANMQELNRLYLSIP